MSSFDYELRKKIADIYAEADVKIIQRMRLKAIEKAIEEARRAEPASGREALN